MARKFFDSLTINVPYFGTDENCLAATAEFKKRFENECSYVTIDHSSWWGSRELHRDYIEGECTDEEFSEIAQIWEQVASDIAEEFWE